MFSSLSSNFEEASWKHTIETRIYDPHALLLNLSCISVKIRLVVHDSAKAISAREYTKFSSVH